MMSNKWTSEIIVVPYCFPILKQDLDEQKKTKTYQKQMLIYLNMAFGCVQKARELMAIRRFNGKARDTARGDKK